MEAWTSFKMRSTQFRRAMMMPFSWACEIALSGAHGYSAQHSIRPCRVEVSTAVTAGPAHLQALPICILRN